MGDWRRKIKVFSIKVAAKPGTILLFLVLCSLFFVLPVLAQAPPLNLGLEYAEYTGLANTDIRMIIAKIIRAALGLLGLVALCFTIYGGYMYMTAGGNEEKIATAKKILKNMVIGLAIILSALGIVQFIINAIYNEYEDRYGQPEWPAGYNEEFVIGGYLGSIIESHYPKRNAPWPGEPPIPRNTQIFVTFKKEIDPLTLIEDTNGDGVYGNIKDGVSDQINSNNIKIYATLEKEAAALAMKPETDSDDVAAYLSDDGRTIIFKPKNYLGDPLKDVNYTVDLKNGVKLLDGALAFSGIGGHYSWQFTVSSNEDLTPPQVENIIPIPLPSPNKYPRNIIVQINFNEAVNPISASGILRVGGPSFQNIMVTTTAEEVVTGKYTITNQYRTVEFISDNQCDVNPCGQPIFCLPDNKDLAATVKSATVDSNNPPQALITSNLYDGVVDAAGNSLDGGGEFQLENSFLKLLPGVNGQAEGPPIDNFWWNFSTSADLDTIAPRLSAINPVSGGGVSPVSPLLFTFDKLMSVGSFRDIILKTNKDFNVWYTPASRQLTVNNSEVKEITDVAHHTQAQLLHGDFWQKPVDSVEPEAIYYPFVPSAVTDIYQNCFYQAVGPGCSTSELSDTKPSCYDGEAKAGASLCGEGEGETCPFGSGPFNPSP